MLLHLLLFTHHTTGSGSIREPLTALTIDEYQSRPAINLEKLLNCFQTVSDLGAHCSIELFTDLPVDGKPELFFDWRRGFPGHCFVQLKKSNLGKTVVLNVGYYPADPWKFIYTMGEIPGKFVDDTQHEYNASARMNLPSQDFAKVILYMKKKVKTAKYDIDDFNCANFAIEAFNSARSNDPLIIPKNNIPRGTTGKGSETPQGLYRELFRLKRDKMAGVEFTFPQNKAYAESTKIPCK